MITNEIKEYAIKENIRQIKEALAKIELFLSYEEAPNSPNKSEASLDVKKSRSDSDGITQTGSAGSDTIQSKHKVEIDKEYEDTIW
mgnify:CR=1 FL=1